MDNYAHSGKLLSKILSIRIHNVTKQQLCADSDNLTIHRKKFFPLINNNFSDTCNCTLYECINVKS